MYHYNVPDAKRQAYFESLREPGKRLPRKSQLWLTSLLHLDEEHRRPSAHWEIGLEQKLAGKEEWRLADIFPKESYAALDVLLGEEFRKAFFEICERMIDYMYPEGYLRRMIRSKNYRHHLSRINHDVLRHFVTCRMMGYDVMTMIRGDFKDNVQQYLSDHIALEIDRGNDEVIGAIREAILSENNTTILTYPMIRGILQARNEELLGLLEKLLLAAQRQEGIRQAICENIDHGLQENFVRFFDVIVAENLVRFSSVKRAIATFTGIGSGFAERITKKELQLIDDLNHGRVSADDLVTSEDNVVATLGLWKKGSEDISALLQAAEEIALHGKRHSHLMLSYYLNFLSDERSATLIAKRMIRLYCSDDATFEREKGLEIVACYFPFLSSSLVWSGIYRSVIRKFSFFDSNKKEEKELFHCLERALLAMKTKQVTFSPCIFPWYSASIEKSDLARSMGILAKELGGEYLDRMTDYVGFLEWGAAEYLERHYPKPKTERQKEMLITLLGDRAMNTKKICNLILENDLVREYLAEIEGYFRLKTPDIRRAVFLLLESQDDEGLRASIERLIVQTDVQKRLGALELLLDAKKNGRFTEPELRAFVEKMPKATTAEQVLIDTLFSAGKSADNRFYRADYRLELPLTLTGSVETKNFFSKTTEELYALLKKWSALYEAHGDYEYQDAYGRDCLLRDMFSPLRQQERFGDFLAIKEYPLAELWERFYEEEIGEFNTLHQLYLMIQMREAEAKSPEVKRIFTYLDKLFGKKFGELGEKLEAEPIPYCGRGYYQRPVLRIIEVMHEEKKRTHLNEVFELAKSVFAKMMEKFSVRELAVKDTSWGKEFYGLCFSRHPMLREWLEILDDCRDEASFREIFSMKLKLENEMLELAEDTGIPYTETVLYFSEVAYAVRLGIASPDLFYKKVFSSDRERLRSAVSTITAYLLDRVPDPNRRGYNEFLLSPENIAWVKEHGQLALDEIVSQELLRGDMPLPYSSAIYLIRRIEGLENMIAILKAMGNLKLDRNSWYGSAADSKKGSLSHLLKVSQPLPTDSAEDLKKLLEGTDITEQRLTEVAMYAPQWIPILEAYLGWKGMASGCYYFHAHTSDVDEKKAGLFAKYTPISIEDFREGAFDLDWFRECYQELGAERFDMLYESAKYISDGAKHSRARKFADAVLGKREVKEVEEEISAKRNKDLLASYGLIPLAKSRDKDLLRRYKFLQNFLKESKQFGSQRRASEARAFQIALDNLSRNAGYSDSLRLILGMESALMEEMQPYFSPKTVDGFEVRILIHEDGTSKLVFEKDAKQLKSQPAALKKNEYVEALKKANKNLKEQYSRAKKMFEESMEDGTEFYAEEIAVLIQKNPVIAPLLQNLVMKSGEHLGYFDAGKLISPTGSSIEVEGKRPIVIAHALDLYRSGEWRAYQEDLFTRQVKQPFKQVFRELYVKTEDEAGKYESLRYAGHQIQVQKAIAVLKTRRWVVEDEGGLQKVYYKQNLIAKMYALADWYSPADIEAPTLEEICFFDRKTFRPISLDEVPDLIFSEVMRDIDLAVSVAHVGGVDPETSHSTIEMRRVIAEFNLKLFKIKNVSFTDKHALIKGKLGEYSIHLGSGLVHQKAGAVIHVLPVHSQHRGKLFLPFVDEDPKTAEIMSKILLFAKDGSIKDPSILNRIEKKTS